MSNNKEYRKQYYQKNKEEIKVYWKTYKEKNKEKLDQYQKQHYQANKNKKQQLYQANKTEINKKAGERNKKYRKENPLFRVSRNLRT